MQLIKKLFKPVDASSIAIFRIALGLILLIDIWRFFVNGWIEEQFILPEFHFSYFGFSWVAPWPPMGMYVHFALLALFAFCIMVGFFYRLAAWGFFFGFTYVFLLDQAQYLNHFYFVCLISLLMAFIPANACLSLDALFFPKVRSSHIPTWCLWILRFQIGCVYFFGGIAKINTDWLQGEPLRMWMASRHDMPVIGPLLNFEPTIYFLSYGGLLFDLLIPFALLSKRTRLSAFLCVLFFHITNTVIFHIGIFPWLTIVASTLFFDPDWPRRVFRLPSKAYTKTFQTKYLTLFLLTVYIVWQVFLPLRHFLYPSSVHWTEEGHLFAWHMKLRSKWGDIFFVVKDPTVGLQWKVDPHIYLTERQVRKMAGRPEMILQFAHYLAARFGGSKEVFAYATASVNGRKQQLLIDPRRNLAEVESSLLPADWIIPLDKESGPLPLYP